jgi:hypothetical protein
VDKVIHRRFSGKAYKVRMRTHARPRDQKDKALDESLAAWLGWFSSAPLPAELACLVEQLEAAYGEAPAQAAATADL